MSIYGQMAQIGSSGGGAIEEEVFGDGSDGVGLFTSNTTWDAPTEDTGMIIKQFKSLTIAQGVTVSAGNRNCGMIVRVQGNCTINGTLENRMSPKTLRDVDNVDFSMWPLSMLNTIAGQGATGESSVDDSMFHRPSQGGKGMDGRFYGGGYGGGGAGCPKNYTYGGIGGDSSIITTDIGEIFIGGAGTPYGGTVSPGLYGGGGGGGGATESGKYYAGGNGGSGPGGLGSSTPVSGYMLGGPGGSAGNYGGGVIILLVGGALIINGNINCNGSDGGARVTYGTHYAGSGGGGGGGIIFICYKDNIDNKGNLLVSPGSGGSGASSGISVIKTFEQYKEEDIA